MKKKLNQVQVEDDGVADDEVDDEDERECLL
jgi:hypothetical protein